MKRKAVNKLHCYKCRVILDILLLHNRPLYKNNAQWMNVQRNTSEILPTAYLYRLYLNPSIIIALVIAVMADDICSIQSVLKDPHLIFIFLQISILSQSCLMFMLQYN